MGAWLPLLMLLAGCAPLGGAEDTGGACGRRPALDYDNYGRAALSKHCTGCHSSYLPQSMRFEAPLGVDFDTYQGVLTYAERIHVRTVEEEDMPPGGGLGGDELAMFDEWIACGVYADLEALAAQQEAR
jgi:uncharacterized membrane protein